MAAIKVYKTDMFSNMLEAEGFKKKSLFGNCYLIHVEENAPVCRYCLEKDGTAIIEIGNNIQKNTIPFENFLEFLAECYKNSEIIKIMS